MKKINKKEKVVDGSKEIQAALTMETGVSFADRTLYIFGGIDTSTAYKFFIPFQTLDKTGEWIRVVLNSPGGEETAGFALYDMIKNSNSPVLIDGYGSVFSIASMILQAGTARRLSPECRFMVHSGSVGLSAEVETNTFVALGEELKIIHSKYKDIIGSRSTKSKEEVSKLCDKESYLSAEDAVAWGFADGVIHTGQDIEVSVKKVKRRK